jgi:hypothetical protein
MAQWRLPLHKVLDRVGVGSVDSLIRECRLLSGVTPRNLVASFAVDAFIGLCVQAAHQRTSAPPRLPSKRLEP